MEREQMVMRSSFETKYGSMIAFVVVILVMTAIFLNYSRNVRDSNRQEELAVYAPLAMDEQVGDYHIKHAQPGMSIPLPTSFPEGAANPSFCKFVGAKSSELYADYSLEGIMEIGIYQAGDRINAHMIKSRWKPYDFIKQSDAVAMIYVDGEMELSYMFLVNTGKPNGCHIMWGLRKTVE